MGSVKSSSTDYNESNKPKWKSLAHIGSEKSLVELSVPKNRFSLFFTFFTLLNSLLFYPKLCFLKHITYRQSSAIVYRQVAGVDARQKILDHVGFVPQQSTDKIGD